MKLKKHLLGAAWICLCVSQAHGQSSPNFTYGQVPTAGQWNSIFSKKQDTLGFVPLNQAGGTLTGKLTTAVPTTASAGFNLPLGTGPLAPKDGDIWTTNTGLYVQINGATVGPIRNGNVAGPSTSVVGNIATFGNVSGSSIIDSGKAIPSGAIVGTSDTQTLTNKTLTAPAISSPVITGSLKVGSINGLIYCPATTGICTAGGIFDSTGNNITLGLSTYSPGAGGAFDQYNLAIGPNTLASIPGSNQNVAIGWGAMQSLTGTSGGQNVAVGTQVMPFATTTKFATALGTATLRNITTGGYGSVAIGHGAAGGDDVYVGVGFNNMPATGQQNTNVGSWSGQEQTAASGQACFGTNSCLEVATGSYNTAMGFGALMGNSLGINSYLNANAVSYATCVGNFACMLTSGGYQSAKANGYINFLSNPSASTSITIGTTSVTFVSSGATGNQVNIGANLSATLANLTTFLNASSDPQLSLCTYWVTNLTQLAVQAKVAGSSGNAIALATTVAGATANGNGAGLLLPAAVTPYPVVAMGYAALQNNVNGQENTAIGYTALNKSVADVANTAVGNGALTNTNGGNSNTAVGDLAAASNTTGASNTAMGHRALYANLTGSSNTAIGQTAAQATTVGGVTAVGAGSLTSNTSGGSNTAVGYQSMFANTTGQFNVAVGSSAAVANTTGSSNTAIGHAAGSGVAAASNNTSLGFQAHNANDGFSNVTAVGASATPTASNQVILGNSSVTSFVVGNATGVSCAAGTVNISTMVVTNGIITHC
ncbi:hypothetical protein [Rhizobium rhizogenes]|uniref:beta strand repeat-containing protein n=1 Tax=Rhizobium rhizogenes TaxID=359 RepID=UPI00226E6DD3|nr:hypothetical protein [Rhizobium rhizogenes]